MAIVWIPAQLRELTGGCETLSVPGSTVGEVIDSLDDLYAGIKSRLCDANGLRPGLAVAVDTQIAPLGLKQSLTDASEVHFVPAVSGG